MDHHLVCTSLYLADIWSYANTGTIVTDGQARMTCALDGLDGRVWIYPNRPMLKGSIVGAALGLCISTLAHGGEGSVCPRRSTMMA